MSKDEEKGRGFAGDQSQQQQQQYYGTFQGGPHPQPPPYNSSQPFMGFPQPVPPAGLYEPSAPPTHPPYAHGYQAVQGYAVVDGRPLREHRLPFCGCGVGWFLFILGFLLAAIPWYVGAFILLCVRIDYREKAGLIACTIAGVLAAIAVVIGATSD